jgi:hypothetical protein
MSSPDGIARFAAIPVPYGEELDASATAAKVSNRSQASSSAVKRENRG